MLVDGVSVVLGSFRLDLSKSDCAFASALLLFHGQSMVLLESDFWQANSGKVEVCAVWDKMA